EEWRRRLGSIDFSMKLLEEAEVAVSPGRGFGEAGEGYLRLALVENEHRLRQAGRQIARGLKDEQRHDGRGRFSAGHATPPRCHQPAVGILRLVGGTGRSAGRAAAPAAYA